MSGRKEYDLICSLGGNCSVAHNLLYKGLRHYSLPFDWVYMKNDKPIEYLSEGFKNNFNDFLLKENLEPLIGDEYNNIHTNRAQYKDTLTGFYFVNHFTKDANFDEDYNLVYGKIRRRLDRLQEKIKDSNNILFILALEFPIEIEKIKTLKETLDTLYPDKNIDFYLMFFNQKKNSTTKNSNIIVKYIKRPFNIYDFDKTAKEWNFLDNIKISIPKHNVIDSFNEHYKIGKIKNLVSVIISAYNHEKYVQQTIKSIINQTYENIELIIVDDGSKDSTWQKIQEMKEICQNRFTRIHFETKHNEGTCKTYNRLISLAQGEYIYIIASDDIAKPIAIEKELEFLSQHKDYALCVGDNEFINSDGKIIYWSDYDKQTLSIDDAKYKTFGEFLKKLRPEVDFNSSVFGSYASLYIGNYIPNGYLIRKSIFKKIGEYTPKAPLEDYWLMLQISKYAKFKYIDEILFSYRQHEYNTIKNYSHLMEITKRTRKYENKILKKLCFIKYRLKVKKFREENTFLQNIFSVKNSKDKKYKRICILGFKFKILRRYSQKHIG